MAVKFPRQVITNGARIATSEGDVGGIWLISAIPDLFSTLATAAIREWKFEPNPAKIRIVLEFLP